MRHFGEPQNNHKISSCWPSECYFSVSHNFQQSVVFHPEKMFTPKTPSSAYPSHPIFCLKFFPDFRIKDIVTRLLELYQIGAHFQMLIAWRQVLVVVFRLVSKLYCWISMCTIVIGKILPPPWYLNLVYKIFSGIIRLNQTKLR